MPDYSPDAWKPKPKTTHPATVRRFKVVLPRRRVRVHLIKKPGNP